MWRMPEGITYNAYLVTGPEGVVVVDGWKRGCGELLVNTIRDIVDPRDVRFVIANHLEPDHSGSLPELVGEAKNAVVLAHPIAGWMLESFYGLGSRFRSVADGSTLELCGLRFRFIHTPWLHWPDTMVSYLEDEKILFTCDIYGSYGVPSAVFYEDLPEEERALFERYSRKYFANVIGGYRDWVSKNLAKLESVAREAGTVATGHGPLYRDPGIPLSLYKSLASEKPAKGKALVVYGSMYGFSEDTARLVVEGLKRRGLTVVLAGFTDRRRDDESEIVSEAYDSEYLVFVSPTYETEVFPLLRYIVELLSRKTPASSKKTLAVSVYGWAGAGRKLGELLAGSGFRVVEVVEIKGSPVGYVDKLEKALDKLVES